MHSDDFYTDTDSRVSYRLTVKNPDCFDFWIKYSATTASTLGIFEELSMTPFRWNSDASSTLTWANAPSIYCFQQPGYANMNIQFLGIVNISELLLAPLDLNDPQSLLFRCQNSLIILGV